MVEPSGFIFLEYVLESSNCKLPIELGKAATIPSSMAAAKDALHYRSTRAAKRILSENQIDFSRRTVSIFCVC